MTWYVLQDDLSGRQRWNISPAPGGGYYIRILYGRAGCNQYLSALPCGNNAVTFAPGDAGAGLQSWRLIPGTGPPVTPAPPPPPANPATFPFPNGQYLIGNTGRAATAGCTSLLSSAACSTGNGVMMAQSGTHPVFTLALRYVKIQICVPPFTMRSAAHREAGHLLLQL